MEVQGIEKNEAEKFPFSGIKVLGSIQTGIGTLCIILGGVNLALTLVWYDQNTQILTTIGGDSAVQHQLITTLVITCTPVWCGMWFIISGSIGTCVSRIRAHSLQFFRNTFLTLSLLCAALFGPACLGVSCAEAYYRHLLRSDDIHWLIPMGCAFLSFFEIILAIVSASVCCCCSPVKLTKIHVLFGPSTKGQPQAILELEHDGDSRVPSPYGLRGQGRFRALPAPYPNKQTGTQTDTNTIPQVANTYIKLKKWALPADPED